MDILFKCKASIIDIFFVKATNILLMCKAFIFLPRDAELLSVAVTHRSVVCLSSLLFVQRVKSDFCLSNKWSQITFFEPKVDGSLWSCVLLLWTPLYMELNCPVQSIWISSTGHRRDGKPNSRFCAILSPWMVKNVSFAVMPLREGTSCSYQKVSDVVESRVRFAIKKIGRLIGLP